MNTKEIRLECLRLAGIVNGIFSAVKTPQTEMAETYAAFCDSAGPEDDDLYLKALQISVDGADRRMTPDVVVVRAQQLVDFANPPKPVVQPTPQRGRKGKRNTSR